jgi:hypothetical protein
MARIIEFQGRRIQVPDDASDAEVEQILTAQPAETPAEKVPAATPDIPQRKSLVDLIMDGSSTNALMPEPDWGEYLGGITDQVGRNLVNGAINVVGLPHTLSKLGSEVTEWGLGKAGVDPVIAAVMSKNPVTAMTPDPDVIKGWLDSANNATADLFDVERPRTEPDNLAERYAARTADVVGGALLPVGGGLLAAERLGVQASKELPWLTRMLVEPAAVAPGKFAAKEMSVATGAGLGSSTANEAFPDSALADFIGGLVGGGAVGLTRKVGGALKDVASAFFQRSNFTDQVVRDAVVDRLGKAANLPGADEIGTPIDTRTLVDAITNPNANRPSSVIPGYKESLADTTSNPGLASLEYGRQQGQNSGLFTQRRMANNEAVDGAMTNLQPKETPGAFRDALALERDRRLMDAETMAFNSEDEVVRTIRGLMPTTTSAQRGNTVRSVLEDARDAARNRTETAYDAVEGIERNVDPSPLAQSLDEAVAGLTETERGLLPQGLIERVTALGRPTLDDAGNKIAPAEVSMREATTLRSELARLRRAAQADPRAERGGRNAARVINRMQERVDDFIAHNLTDEENALMDTARTAKFDEAERFTRQGDPVAEVLQRYEGGQPKVRDDNVAGKFVNDQNMGRLLAQADTPGTRAAIRDELLSRADMSRPDRINDFLTEYGQQVDRFPGLREDLGRAMQTRQNALSATENRDALARDLGTESQPGRSTVGKYLNYSDATSERAMSDVLASKDPAKAADELMQFVGDEPKAIEGARSAFWQKLKSESTSTDNSQRSMSGKDAWRGDWMKRWLDKPETQAVAERLYADKPEDLATLRLYADVLDNADLRVRGKATATSGTTQGMANNIMTPETLQSRTYAYMRGQVSGTYLATSIAAVIARRAVSRARTDAVERMTDKALLDPEFAKALLADNNPANRAALASKSKGWLTSEMATWLDEATDEDPDKALKDAVMGGN